MCINLYSLHIFFILKLNALDFNVKMNKATKYNVILFYYYYLPLAFVL